MKKVLLLIALVAGMVACNKPKQETITVSELKTKYGIDLIAAYAMEEEATSKAGGTSASSKGKGKPTPATVITVSVDLLLTFDGSSYVSTLPPNPTFGGVQSASSEALENLASACNWYLAQWQPCTDNSGAAWHRSWSGDADFNVHLSPPINQ